MVTGTPLASRLRGDEDEFDDFGPEPPSVKKHANEARQSVDAAAAILARQEKRARDLKEFGDRRREHSRQRDRVNAR